MLDKSLRTEVHAQFDTVWSLLLDRIEHPREYDSRIRDTRIVERTPDNIVREVHMDGMLIRERISVDEEQRVIRSEVLEHPDYSGVIDTVLINTSRQNPMSPVSLDINLKLEMKEDHREGSVKPDQFLVDAFTEEIQRIKRTAEERDKQVWKDR